MRFAVDGWDPSYGTSVELETELAESSAQVVTDVETTTRWRPIAPDPGIAAPSAIVFVDGVRRIEARIWIDEVTGSDAATEASAGICASYAAGAVCCRTESGTHLLNAEPRRGLFTVAPHAVDVTTGVGIYYVHHTVPEPTRTLATTLSVALQSRLAELELVAAVKARAGLTQLGIADGTDLMVVDGPLRGRQNLPRIVGFIKSHQRSYLPSDMHALVGTLRAGERTPVFLMSTNWRRHSWYLRLPCPAGAPWAGIVRLECSADIPSTAAAALANISQAVLPRFASTEYKDSRAPQNLYPIAGLERELRRRLGDPRLLYRALREAATA